MIKPIIADIALDALVKNPSVDSWCFTDEELQKFTESIVEEICDMVIHLERYHPNNIIVNQIKKRFMLDATVT